MDGDDDVLLNDAAENEDTFPHSNNKHASVHVRGGSSTSKKLVFFAVTLVRRTHSSELTFRAICLGYGCT